MIMFYNVKSVYTNDKTTPPLPQTNDNESDSTYRYPPPLPLVTLVFKQNYINVNSFIL